MANALLALVSNSRNVNPYFAICQKTISGATSRWSFFFAVLGRLLSRSAWGRAFVCTADDLSRRPIQQAVFKGLLGVALLPNGQYGLLVALFRFRSIRALGRPISLSLNTGSGSGYVLGLWPLRAYASAGRGYVLGLWPLRAYACGSSSIARWGIRRANADWERPGGRLSN